MHQTILPSYFFFTTTSALTPHTHTFILTVIDGVAVPVAVAVLVDETNGVLDGVSVDVNDTLAVNDGVSEIVGLTEPENVVPTDTVAVAVPVIVEPDDSEVDGLLHTDGVFDGVTEMVGVFDGVTEMVGVFEGVPVGVFDAPSDGVPVAVPVIVM